MNDQVRLGATSPAWIEASPLLLLHAGAVSHRGRAIIFPGDSGCGKSTVTAACVLQGLDYVTDETVGVDLATLRITGLSAPIMLTPWSARALGVLSLTEASLHARPHGKHTKVGVSAEQLGGRSSVEAVPASHIVLLRGQVGKTRLEALSAGEVLTELLKCSFNHYRHGVAAWRACTQLTRHCRGWRLSVMDPLTAGEAVAALANGAHPSASTASK